MASIKIFTNAFHILEIVHENAALETNILNQIEPFEHDNYFEHKDYSVSVEGDSVILDLTKRSRRQKTYDIELERYASELYSYLRVLKSSDCNLNVRAEDGYIIIERTERGSSHSLQKIIFAKNDLTEFSGNQGGVSKFFTFRFGWNKALYFDEDSISFITGNPKLFAQFGVFRYLDNPLREVIIRRQPFY